MKRKLIFSLLALAAFLAAAETFPPVMAGQPGYEFLRTQAGARASALGGAFVAVAGDIYSVYYNPAGLATLGFPAAGAGAPVQQVAFSYLNHFLDFQSGFLAYAHRLGASGTVAAALRYLDYGQFDRTDELGNKQGTFGAGNFLLQVGYGFELSRNFSVGIGLKYIHGKIAQYSSSAWAADFGLLYRIPSQDLNFGFAVLNSGQVLDPYVETKDPLPVSYRLGLSKRLAHLPLLLVLEGYLYRGEDAQFIIGGEFTLTPFWLLRLSYNSIGKEQRIGQVGDRYAGLSIGTGFSLDKSVISSGGFWQFWKKIDLDYSFTSAGHIGTLNRFSVRFEF